MNVGQTTRYDRLIFHSTREEVLHALSEGVTLREIVARYGYPNTSAQELYTWIWNNDDALRVYWKSNRGLKRYQTELLYKLLPKKDRILQLLKEGAALPLISREVGIEYNSLRYFVRHDQVLRAIFHDYRTVRVAISREKLLKVLRESGYNQSVAALLCGVSREAIRQQVQRRGLTEYVARQKERLRRIKKLSRRKELIKMFIDCKFDREKVAKKLGISYQAVVQRCVVDKVGTKGRHVFRTPLEMKNQIKAEYNIEVGTAELGEAIFFTEEFSLEYVVRTLLKYRERMKIGGKNG